MGFEVIIKSGNEILIKQNFFGFGNVSELCELIIRKFCFYMDPLCVISYDGVSLKRNAQQNPCLGGLCYIKPIKDVELGLIINEDSLVIDIGKKAEQRILKLMQKALSDVRDLTVSVAVKKGLQKI